MSYRNHAWRHHPTKGTDPIEVTASGSDFYSSPLMIPLLSYPGGNAFEGGFFDAVIDSTVTYNAVMTNSSGRTPAVNDYLAFGAKLGPKGSNWGLMGTYVKRPDGGTFLVEVATLKSPNPNRGGSNDEGTVEQWYDAVYHGPNTPNNSWDTYAAAVAEFRVGSFLIWFRLGGADGDTYTATSSIDPYTGYPIIDGGAGYYKTRLKVTGKNAASSGYRVDITSLAWVTIDDDGVI